MSDGNSEGETLVNESTGRSSKRTSAVTGAARDALVFASFEGARLVLVAAIERVDRKITAVGLANWSGSKFAEARKGAVLDGLMVARAELEALLAEVRR